MTLISVALTAVAYLSVALAPNAFLRSVVDPEQAAPLADAPPFVSKVLANGLEIIVLEDHSIPLVTVNLAVRNGSFTEPPELNGLSHLYEHMFFKTNEAMLKPEPYTKTIGQAGLAYNGETREELVEYYFTTTTPNLSTAMRFLRDAARYPLFDEGELAREKEVVVGELDRQMSNPYGTLQAEVTGRLFHEYTSRKRPSGTPATVRGTTTAMMKLIQGRYYVPNNAAIIVMGDASPQSVFLMAEDLFGDWPKRPVDPFVEFPPVTHPPLVKSEGAILIEPIQNVIVQVGWHGPSIGKDDAATYAADVFSFILRQPDSRFQRALVDTGLVSGVDLNYLTQRNVGPINVILQTTSTKARAAVQALYAEIAHFNDPDSYTNAQLESAKALLEADDLYSREKLSEYSKTTAFWWSTAGLGYFRTYLARLRATSRADISRYVATYIQGRPHVGVALLSDESRKQSGLTEADLIGPPAARAARGVR